MIKLNNKNITYVALADSNNSLKAPKEIWYADSNNSVKLVYRRKDALIEGEDYEKYHWLKGDGDATITHKDVNTLDIKILELDSTGIYYAVGYYATDSTVIPTKLYIGRSRKGGNYSGLVIYNVFGTVISNYRTPSLSIDLGEHIITKTTETDQIGVYTDNIRHIKNATSDIDYIGTDIIFNQLIPSQSLYIGYLSSPNIHNLIPCKLLKPVPKWLDANGIRRQVGECGMIDLVSGKFYGNVNSVGTFTVENYYERKEWLCGDGSAYIDTDIIVDVPTLRYSLEFIHDTNNTEFLCGSRNSTSNDEYSSAIVIDNVHNNMIRLDAICSPSYSLLLYSNIIPNAPNEVHINCQTNSAIVNNSRIPGNRTIFNNSSYTFRIFSVYPKDNSTYPNTCTCKISYFTLNDSTHSLDLIPCTLTMDLPASMDANNIARTKGTSGMWDLVSDRFYGNVANSGTFKAVNLAEGVDYEVHQWLVGDDTAYIQGITFDLWNNHFNTRIGKNERLKYFSHYVKSTAANFKIEVDSIPNLVVIFRNDENGKHIADFTPYSAMPNVIDFDFYIDNSTFYCNRDGVIYTNSGTNIAIESNWTSIQPMIKSAKISYIREVLPDGSSYRSNLIPVKLLHSIPSKYDANEIARQAGECGMYDTVNDLFYGNVANSGTFSVEDDN